MTRRKQKKLLHRLQLHLLALVNYIITGILDKENQEGLDLTPPCPLFIYVDSHLHDFSMNSTLALTLILAPHSGSIIVKARG